MRTVVIVCAVLACLLSCNLADAVPIQWKVSDGGNGHYYELVMTTGNWQPAVADASSRYHQGIQGHLVTITSQGENDFIVSNFGPSGVNRIWIGATDISVEGEWRWFTGPEAGQQFWQGGSAGYPIAYANWHLLAM